MLIKRICTMLAVVAVFAALAPGAGARTPDSVVLRGRLVDAGAPVDSFEVRFAGDDDKSAKTVKLQAAGDRYVARISLTARVASIRLFDAKGGVVLERKKALPQNAAVCDFGDLELPIAAPQTEDSVIPFGYEGGEDDVISMSEEVSFSFDGGGDSFGGSDGFDYSYESSSAPEGCIDYAQPFAGARPDNGASYDSIIENPFKPAAETPFSTFSIDADGAAYANIRRYLNSSRIPPENAVRIEEMINYFDYPTYKEPRGGKPFSVIADAGECPWNPEHRLLRVALKGRDVPLRDVPPLNLVFLVDVSGSMNAPNKLPLVKESLRMLVERLRPNDRVALATYASSSGLALPSTAARERGKILDAINDLDSGGSTAGGAGIKLAYNTLRKHFSAGGVNRVILATDGDFNVGVNNPDDLVKLIEKERDANLYLTVLGYGQGNYRDDMTERLSNAGNGYAAYIDSKAEARKVLVDEFAASMLTIANDVKLQLEFNQEVVKSYRLIGYKNRLLNYEDFKDDKVDAGDVGAGHTVTALYELVPAGNTTAGFRPAVTVNLRYKTPGDTTSKPLTYDVVDRGARWTELDADFRFAASAAAFGMLLRGSEYSGSAALADVKKWASAASANDPNGRRKEFLGLVDNFDELRKARDAGDLKAGK